MVNEQGEAHLLYTLSGEPREAFSKFPLPRNTEIFGAKLLPKQRNNARRSGPY